MPHQELQVIDLLRDGSKQAEGFETLRPSESLPEPPPILGDEKQNVLSQNKIKQNKLTPQAYKIEKADKEKSSLLKTKKAKQDHDPLIFNKKKNPKASETPSKINDDSVFLVQLAAFRSIDKAEEIANLLSEKHKSRLKGMKLKTMRFDTGSNGVFYRVVSAPVLRAEAEYTCDMLRKAGQDCFLRKFVMGDD